ncbi:hypothetical protein V474_04445 [Novosphingobium barchaimii LL02]|uniref:Uncharacterized protein n=1 Tax=Novosphingobium barchaimii LL02 TaxID=1114963 RepID=A0A0J7XHH6_9SPHN|nr:hypothetical protein V474_04445 [Novosphingobium barchaimii LL02]
MKMSLKLPMFGMNMEEGTIAGTYSWAQTLLSVTSFMRWKPKR